MKTIAGIIVIIFCFYGLALYAKPEKGKVVFMQHSIRWMDESNFPYYLKLQEVRKEILEGVDERLKQAFGLTEIERPDEFDYRVINGFGKAKIEWPKTINNNVEEIALISVLSRDVSSWAITWSIEIDARYGGKVVYSKIVTHEIVPVSYSCYLTGQRWIEQDEFSRLLLRLVEEALGLTEDVPSIIEVGSMDAIAFKINSFLPVDEHYTLSIAGGILREANSAYLIKKDSIILENFKYREGRDETRVKRAVLSEIANNILYDAGLDVMFSSQVKEIRWGKLITTDGSPLEFRLSWLDTTNPNALVTVGKTVVSPIVGEIYDKKNPGSVYSTYVYYKELNSNNEELDKNNYRLSLALDRNMSPYKSYGTLGVSVNHYINGKYGSNDFKIVYVEQEGIVFFNVNGKEMAALSMFNENKESRSFSGMKLSVNKKSITSKTQSNPDPLSPEAERYSLFTTDEVKQEHLDDYLTLLTMLFFSIGQTNGHVSIN